MPSPAAFRILPLNYLKDWGEFESWAQGVASAPDGWIKATAPTVAREATSIKYGSYSALVIGSTGGIGGIYLTIPNGVDYAGRTFSLGVWGKSSSTGPYIEIHDGVTSHTAHLDGLNAFSFVTTPIHKMDYATTQFKISLFATQNATAYFDGAVLCEGEDLFTELSQSNILVDDWSPTINIRQDQYELAQREGSEIPDAHVQAQSIRLRGTVVGTDVRSCRTNFDTLLKAALSWKTNEKRHIYLYEDRCREVFLKSFDWQYINSLQYIKYNMQLTDADASSRYIGKIRNRTVIAATVTEFNFAYNGNFESKPYISIIANQGATITTCLLENLTTGENFSYTGTVPSGVALNIDCLAGTVLNSSADSISLFSGDFVRLVRGTNYFRFSGQNCEIDIDYFERYL